MTVPAITINRDTSAKKFHVPRFGRFLYNRGQDVPSQDNYPNQAIRLLKNDHLYGQVKIIATTGWTTNNLKTGIEND